MVNATGHMSHIQDYNVVPSTAQLQAPVRQRHEAVRERLRAARACDGCRRTKEKCVGDPCQRCLHLGRHCEFTNLQIRRRAATKTRGHNQSAAATTSKPLDQQAVTTEQMPNHHLPRVMVNSEQRRATAQSLRHEESVEAQDPAAASESEYGEDLAIEDENCTINAIGDTTAHFSGEFSLWNFSMRLNRQVKDFVVNSDQGLPPQYWRVEQLNPSSSVFSEVLSHLPPFQVAEFLTHTFFQHATSNYFFVEPAWLSEKLKVVYANPQRACPPDVGILAIILGILAVGTQYAHLQSSSKERNEINSKLENELGSSFYQQAARMLPDLIHLGSLESVQACLVLGLYSLPVDACGLGYIYLNLAIKLAQQNGMHRQDPEHIFSAQLSQIRKKVWWTAFCMEKKISSYHGRPVSVRLKDIDMDLPCDEVLNESSRSTPPTSNLVAVVKLMNYLDRFCEEMNNLRACQKQEIIGSISRLDTIKKDLKMWWDGISVTAMPPSRATIHLQLEYCLVRMFVGRPFLFRRGTALSQSPGESVNPDQQSPTNRRLSCQSALVNDCLEAASQAIDLCQSLRDVGPGLAKASYIEYHSCRASLLVFIAFSIRSQTLRCQNYLQKGLDILGDMSPTGDSARSEILLIKALERAVRHIYSLKSNPQSDSSTERRPKITYDDFAQWGATWKVTAPSSNADLSHTRPPSGQNNGNDLPNTFPEINELRNPDMGAGNQLSAVDMTYTSASFDNQGPEIGRDPDQPPWAFSPFYHLDGLSPGSIDPYMHSERQLLEDFVAGPEWDSFFLRRPEIRQQ